MRIALCRMIRSFLSHFSRLSLLSAPSVCTLIEAARRFIFFILDGDLFFLFLFYFYLGMWKLCGNDLLQRGYRINFSMDQVSCTCTEAKTKAGRNKCECGNQLVYGDALTCGCGIFAVTVITTNILLTCSTLCPNPIKSFTDKMPWSTPESCLFI